MPEGRNKRSLTARDRRPLDVRLRPFKSSSASQLLVPLAFSRRCSGYSLRCGREIVLSLRRWRGRLSVMQRYKNGLYIPNRGENSVAFSYLLIPMREPCWVELLAK